jgi:hypothetical protein
MTKMMEMDRSITSKVTPILKIKITQEAASSFQPPQQLNGFQTFP